MLEQKLWKAANKLRGLMDPTESQKHDFRLDFLAVYLRIRN